MDASDSWRVLHAFVAGLRGNPNFTTDLKIKHGVSTAIVQKQHTVRKAHRAKYFSNYKKLDRTKLRRHISKQRRNHLMAKDSKSPHRHKTEKVKPKLLNKKKSKKSKKTTRCSNCKKLGHSSKDCIEPKIIKQKKRGPAVFSLDQIRDMF